MLMQVVLEHVQDCFRKSKQLRGKLETVGVCNWLVTRCDGEKSKQTTVWRIDL